MDDEYTTSHRVAALCHKSIGAEDVADELHKVPAGYDHDADVDMVVNVRGDVPAPAR